MRKILLASAAAIGLLFGVSAQAGTTTGNFNVNINLTSNCILVAPTDINIDYTSLVGVTANTGGAFSVTCTGSLPYTFALDQTNVTDAVVGIAYTLTLPAAVAGTGASQGYTITAAAVAGQAGTCTTLGGCSNALSGNKQRTLTVTF